MRTKDGTAAILWRIFELRKTIRSATAAKKLQTKTGIKDVFQDYFTDRIAEFMDTLTGSIPEKQAAVNEYVKNLPENVSNPLWKLKGMCIFCELQVL